MRVVSVEINSENKHIHLSSVVLHIYLAIFRSFLNMCKYKFVTISVIEIRYKKKTIKVY